MDSSGNTDSLSTTTYSNVTSALIGQPPSTPSDLVIIRGIYRMMGLTNETMFDPAKGLAITPKAPAGYVYNDKQAAIIAGMVLVFVVIVSTTGARLLVKMRSPQTLFGLDDVAIIPAALLAASYPMLQILMVIYGGGGKHVWDTTYSQYVSFTRLASACSIIFYAAVALIKVSITLFVRRLAACMSKGWRVFADVFLATLVADLAASLLWTTLNCNPPAAAWDVVLAGSLPGPARCGDFALMTKVLSTVHFVQGVVLLSSPVIILWKVRMDPGKKLRMFIVWWFGGITVLGGLLQQVAPGGGGDGGGGTAGDLTYSYTTVLAWTTLDLTMGIITASLPTLDSAIMGSWRAARSRMSSGRPSAARSRARAGSVRIKGNNDVNVLRRQEEGVEMSPVVVKASTESKVSEVTR